MSSESLPDHLRRPNLRPLQPIPVQHEGKPFLALRDPQMLQTQTMVVPANALRVLQEFRGDKSIEEIAERLQTGLDQLLQLVNGLDQLGLLWGPTFEKLEQETLQQIQTAGAFPVSATIGLGEGEPEARGTLRQYFEQTEDPELGMDARGIVAPHLDYERGWPNYAAAYYGMQDLAAPDRVVILGTNHFGIGDGVVFTDCGFETAFGICPADEPVVKNVLRELGKPVIIDQLDFKAEHSVELHLPWIQYCFGNVPVVAALIPDPLTPLLENDDERVTTEDFLETLSASLDKAGGSTLFVASADLSHVGPQFGEPRAVDDQRRFDVERHDRDMMGKYLSGEVEDFLEAMRWNRNPTRWCSIGNMSAVLRLAEAETIELIDYRQAVDEQGQCLVSSAAMALA